VIRFRRKETTAQRLQRRGRELGKAAPQQLRKAAPKELYETTPKELYKAAPEQLRKAASQLDVPWARSWAARAIREAFLRVMLAPMMDFYIRRRATGRDKLSRVRGPVILVANHRSHIDTPVILAALPRRMRRRTVVAAAADYFYRSRLVGALVSLLFNTVPMDRSGGGLDERAAGHLDHLLDRGWNLLVYPEGTRNRPTGSTRVRRGAAVLAAKHRMPIVPIRVTGTRDAMPPGHFWPTRNHEHFVSKRYPVSIAFGEPIQPSEDVAAAIASVQHFFENGSDGD
jgi:1-acyl-sn-glycerol-3-phosphate acyltransferase